MNKGYRCICTRKYSGTDCSNVKMTNLTVALIITVSLLIISLIGIIFFIYKRKQNLNGVVFSSIGSELPLEDNENRPVINLAQANIKENLRRHSQTQKTGPLAKSTHQALIEGHPALKAKKTSSSKKKKSEWTWQLQMNDCNENKDDHEPTPSLSTTNINNNLEEEKRLSSGGNFWYPSYVGGPTAGVGGNPLNMRK